MSGLLPATAAVGPIGAGSIAIFVVWLVGMLALARCRDRKDMDLVIPAEPATTTTKAAIDRPGKGNALENASTARNGVIFVAASLVTLIAGVVLEQSGDRLADLMGINGVLFGATVLAFASALPEISTAVTGVQMTSSAPGDSCWSPAEHAVREFRPTAPHGESRHEPRNRQTPGGRRARRGVRAPAGSTLPVRTH